MPLHIVQQDASQIRCDAVVSITGTKWSVDSDAEHVIEIDAPGWLTCLFKGERALVTFYEKALSLAWESQYESVAIPLITCKTVGHAKEKALKAAADTIAAFLSDHDMTVFLVVRNRKDFEIDSGRFSDIRSYIKNRYVEEQRPAYLEDASVCYGIAADRETAAPAAAGAKAAAPTAAGVKAARRAAGQAQSRPQSRPEDRPQSYSASLPQSRPQSRPKVHADREEAMVLGSAPESASAPLFAASSLPSSSLPLEALLKQVDESFSEMLLRKIDEAGITDAACYKKANIDRKLFSKIRSDRLYRPSKQTAIAFAIALELPEAEAKEMLMKAGFALSRSSKFDIIIEYFISNGIYNIYEINETLFAFDQPLL